jgi:predicted nucleic acid-binding protein
MIAVDTNILVDAFYLSQPDHENVAKKMESLAGKLCTTDVIIGETLRLVTHKKVFPAAVTIESACKGLESLFAHYGFEVLSENDGWWKRLYELAEYVPGLKANEVFDARIAQCLYDNGIKNIWTYDSDFRKYPFLKVMA